MRYDLYLDGWGHGTRYVERCLTAPRTLLKMARFLLTHNTNDFSRGWADAILSAYGA